MLSDFLVGTLVLVDLLSGGGDCLQGSGEGNLCSEVVEVGEPGLDDGSDRASNWLLVDSSWTCVRGLNFELERVGHSSSFELKSVGWPIGVKDCHLFF